MIVRIDTPKLSGFLCRTVSAVALLAVFGTVSVPVFAQNSEADQAESGAIEEIVTIGSRVKGRTATETTVPVDIITSDYLDRSGVVETARLLRNLAPSFNYYETTIGDGTDILRPATLRGLGPDQLLVLVNGKRRVGFPWIGVGQTVNRGSTGVDFNSIPSAAIKRIEVLRDGASALYGSDAIAGVINIVLRDDTDTTRVQGRWSQSYEGDGDRWNVSANSGFEVGDGGYVNLTVQTADLNRTNRADVSGRTGTVIMRIGDTAISNDWKFGGNAMVPLGDKGEFYAFGTIAHREGLSGGFFRHPFQSDRSVPQVFPNGFLPLQTTEVDDVGAVAGVRVKFADVWELDTAVNYGRNRFGFGAENTVNVSIAAQFRQRNPDATDAEIAANSGPSQVFSGAAESQQFVLTSDLTGQADIGLPDTLYIAAGFQWRNEQYQLFQGDFASFSCGDSAQKINIPSLFQDLSVPADQFSSFANCGVQGFPGYSSEVAGKVTRNNYAVYLNFETNLTPDWLTTGAVRLEHFENTGTKVSGKFSTRLAINSALALRGAVQTGFRAPSLAQIRFTSVTTSAGANGLTQTLLAPNDDPFTQALGIGNLKIETSQNYSVGFVWQPLDGASFTVDAYQINIDNRVTLSGTLDAAALAGNQAAIDSLAARGIGQGQFFTNAINTRTRGVDIVGSYATGLGGGTLNTTVAVSIVDNKVKKVKDVGNISPNLIFNRANKINVEDSAPTARATVTFDYTRNKFGGLIRMNYFGSTQSGFFAFANPAFPKGFFVGVLGADPSDVRKIKRAALFDTELSYDVNEFIQIAAGANNVLNKKPNKLPNNAISRLISDGVFPPNQTFGNFKFPWRGVAYGINGGFYYFRTLIRF